MTGLEVSGLSVRYREALAIDGVSFGVEAGHVTAIVGPLGAGSSTVLRAIAGLVPIEHGTVRLDAHALEGLSTPRRARLGVCYLPPAGGVFPGLTVAENVALMCPGAPDARFVDDAFPELTARWSLEAGKLSGGEQRLLAAVRVVAADTRLVLSDEPFHSLAPAAAQRIELLLAAVAETGRIIVFADHDRERAQRIAHRTIVLHEGRVAARVATRDP